jgi:hypothetical protein
VLVIEILLSSASILISLLTYAWTDHAFVSLISSTKPFFLWLNTYRAYLLYNRHVFEKFFVITIVTLLTFQLYYLFSKKQKIKLWPFIFIGITYSLAYPFFSSDIFSYIFSAKILYVYHQNPYLVIPEVFRDKDIWLSFTYWTHRQYVYGPIFLLYSIVPLMLFTVKRFLLIFLTTKLASGIIFILTGYLIYQQTNDLKKTAFLWFVNPLLIIELLINAHNDLLMIFLFIFSVWLWDSKRRILGITSYVLSVLTKYVSFPFGILVPLDKKARSFISTLLTILFLIILGVRYQGSQVWYFTWLYFTIPFTTLKTKSYFTLFIFQIILLYDKYYGFVSSGNWGSVIPNIAQSTSLIVPIIILIFEKDSLIKNVLYYTHQLHKLFKISFSFLLKSKPRFSK